MAKRSKSEGEGVVSEPSKPPKERAKVNVTIPKDDDLADRLDGITIGRSAKIVATGKIVSASKAGGDWPGSNSSVSVELDDISFEESRRGSTMTDEMSARRHRRRATSEKDEDEEES